MATYLITGIADFIGFTGWSHGNEPDCDLCYEPKINFHEGLRHTIQWSRSLTGVTT